MRRLGSIVAALGITLALFALMQAMIGRQEAPIERIDSDARVGLVAPASDADAAADDAAASAAEAELPPAPAPPPPMPAMPPTPTATPSPPPLEPPPTIQPELARVEPGAKPHLGAIAQPKPKPKPKPKTRRTPKPAQRAAAPAPSPKSTPRAPASSQSAGSADAGTSRRRAGDSRASGSSKGRAARAAPKQGATRAASPISTPRPPYPRAAKRARQEGWVDVQFTINASGRVTGVRVVGSSPRGVFDQVAQRSVSRWRFRPRMVNGKPASQSARQRIHFRLR